MIGCVIWLFGRGADAWWKVGAPVGRRKCAARHRHRFSGAVCLAGHASRYVQKEGHRTSVGILANVVSAAVVV